MRGNDRSIVDRPRHRKLQLVTDHDRTPSGALLPVPGQQHRRTLYQYRSIHPRLSTRQARCAPDSDAARAGLPKFEKISAGCGYTEPPRASLGRRSSASTIFVLVVVCRVCDVSFVCRQRTPPQTVVQLHSTYNGIHEMTLRSSSKQLQHLHVLHACAVCSQC
jgi:hypothetical protein